MVEFNIRKKQDLYDNMEDTTKEAFYGPVGMFSNPVGSFFTIYLDFSIVDFQSHQRFNQQSNGQVKDGDFVWLRKTKGQDEFRELYLKAAQYTEKSAIDHIMSFAHRTRRRKRS